MAGNPFYIEPANPLQALMSGVQGYDRGQKAANEQEMKAGRQDAVAALQSGGDVRGALARLIGIGDVQGAQAIAQYAHQQATLQQTAASQAEASRHNRATEGLAQQQFGLAQKQAEDAARGVEYKEIDDGQGGKTLVRIQKSTGIVERPQIGGVTPEPASPYAPNAKLTGDQAKDRIFVNRMVESHNIINGLEGINQGTGGFIGGVLANQPRIRDSAAFNSMSSSDRQRSIQAQRDFVNAILRKESGAAISQGEFENAQKQYFPQPGDGPDVIAQKKTNRMQAIEGMMQGAGPGYKPPAGYIGTQGPAYPSKSTAPAAPKVGELRDGYRFKGGDPSDQNNWIKAK